ncbi:MAG: HDIG domain-containing protein [Phycisphaerae bacterium]|nr:HDIG domain-containing protein [Phycisphaerae bacterium]
MITRSNTSELRRQEAKRQCSEQRSSHRRNLLAGLHPLTLVIWIGFYVATVVILLSGGDSLPYSQGQKAEQDIRARVDFELLDQVRIHQEKQTAYVTAPGVYIANPGPIEAIRNQLIGMLTIVKVTETPEKTKQLAQERHIPFSLTPAVVQALQNYTSAEASNQYEAMIEKLVDQLKEERIVGLPKNALRERHPPTVILQRDGERQEIPTTTLQFNTNVEYLRERANKLAADIFPEPLRHTVSEVIVSSLTPPSSSDDPAEYVPWRYDIAATTKEINEAQSRVPEYKTLYKERDLLVEKGMVLNNNELNVLTNEHEAFRKAQQTDPTLRHKMWAANTGLAGIALIITFGLAAYTLSYQGRVFQNPGRALGLAGLCLLMISLSRLNARLEGAWNSPSEFSVLCVTMSAMLLTIAYNQRFAFGVSGVLSLLVTLASREDFYLFLTLMAACGVSVFALNEVRTRGKIIAVGGMAGLASMLTCFFGLAYQGQDWRYILLHSASAGVAAVAAGFIVQGILHYFERIFGIATSLTLLEWCDASRPLLRKLAQEAPGTYSHALILSQMVDEASAAIGANGLLARVGALYHDIGKTQKPQYFVENQEARMNRHDRLSPTMSLLIILGHVKDGIEMARAYGMPRVLHQFIAEHHGTTIVKYFHHAANEKAAKDARIRGRHDQISESEFRYPGPKPRSKESAILMICDSCEGAVRALPEPTPGRIETVIHQLIMERLNDGQFDECDITLRELNLVERSLIKSLCAIHHGRIKYPGRANGADVARSLCDDRPQPENGSETTKAPADITTTRPSEVVQHT